MPKIRLAPPSALTCDMQHDQHEEVTNIPVLATASSKWRNMVGVSARITDDAYAGRAVQPA